MIGLVNTSESLLSSISLRLHNALLSSGLKYTANKYGDPIKHPDVNNYALKVITKEDYNGVIMSELTPEEISTIQTIGEDWFPPLNI